MAMLPAWRALAATIAAASGYFIFNGFYVFDKHNLIVDVAGPRLESILWESVTDRPVPADLQFELAHPELFPTGPEEQEHGSTADEGRGQAAGHEDGDAPPTSAARPTDPDGDGG